MQPSHGKICISATSVIKTKNHILKVPLLEVIATSFLCDTSTVLDRVTTRGTIEIALALLELDSRRRFIAACILPLAISYVASAELIL